MSAETAQLELLPSPVARARMEDAWADEEARSTAFLNGVQGAPPCRVGANIHMAHDLGIDWTCKRCGWTCPRPSLR